MALIEVNHSTLNNIADAIEAYCTEQDKEMKTANTAVVTMLFNDWFGEDAKSFAEKWSGVDENGSVTEQFKESLKNYSKCLRACAKEYSKAQEESYNAARSLPRQQDAIDWTQVMETSISNYSSFGNRDTNEDSVRVIKNQNSVFAVIADGLGGMESGELASEITLKAFLSKFNTRHFSDKEMISATYRANSAVRECQSENAAMCSTLAALWLKKNKALVCYVGDTRIYQIRDGRIVYQSVDHSVSQLAVLMGEISPDEIRNHKDRNKLVRAVGADIDIKPQIDTLRVRAEDAFLICSDGFWENIIESDIIKLRGTCIDANEWLSDMREQITNIANDNNSAVAIIVKQTEEPK